MSTTYSLETRVENGVVYGTFALPQNSSAARYLENISQNRASECSFPEPCEIIGTEPEHPFITVVMRTQGKRYEELTDVLLCLQAQVCDDFEIVLVGHKVPAEYYDGLIKVLKQFPEGLLKRMRFYKLDTGGRAMPLELGASVARGSYVVFLDDDDIVTDSWISSFKELSETQSGKILASYCVTQLWKVTKPSSKTMHHELMSASAYGHQYCHDFDPALQVGLNNCPFMSLAFPRYLFSDLHMHFDAELTTTEDWDFLMRAYSICGVANIQSSTAVYRLWDNTENSHVLHDESEWNRNYSRIVDRLDSSPFLLDAGGVQSIRSKSTGQVVTKEAIARSAVMLAYEGEAPVERDIRKSLATVREGSGTGNDAVHYAKGMSLDEKDWAVALEFDGQTPVNALAFSPTDAAFCVMGEFKLQLTSADGVVTELDYADADVHNGSQVDCNHIVFLKRQPYVLFKLPKTMVLTGAKLTYELFAEVSEQYIDQVTLSKTGLMVGRAHRWAVRKLHAREE
ncbi:MAG: glycosyltransferase family 2 protein [Coriobacteriales bacterium]|nr:glycosyltransferase family 2 protein [Coriobacteriales bacterium]